MSRRLNEGRQAQVAEAFAELPEWLLRVISDHPHEVADLAQRQIIARRIIEWELTGKVRVSNA